MKHARRAVLGGLLIVAAGGIWVLAKPGAEGCPTYIPSDQPLIAHAGGGLPGGVYTNSIAALDLAYRHGHRLFELDFLYRDGLVVGWSDRRRGDPIDQVAKWFAEHRDAVLVTDLKDGNRHLHLVAQTFGTDRVMPQIYHPEEYAAARALGFEEIIFTAYRFPEEDRSWIDDVNALDLWAVTIPERRRNLAARIVHPVFLHTVNQPMPGYGLYTDCLIPKGQAAAA